MIKKFLNIFFQKKIYKTKTKTKIKQIENYLQNKNKKYLQYIKKQKHPKKQKYPQNQSKNILKTIESTILIIAAVLGFAVFPFTFAKAAELPAPTILKPESVNLTTAKPLIAGVSVNDTRVEIYIDNLLVGSAVVNNHTSGVGNFFWQPDFSIQSGVHGIKVRAVNVNNDDINSDFSDFVFVNILPLGAPTLIAPNVVKLNKPFHYVEGVAHNNSIIDVVLDGRVIDTFNVGEDASGSVGFKHELKDPITSGAHTLYLQARDITGRLSAPSKTINIIIADFPAPTILNAEKLIKTFSESVSFTGLAFNNSEILVFVNGKLDGSFSVKNHPSGTANFAYVAKNLERGRVNTIFVKVRSRDGRVSKESNKLFVFVEYYYVPPTLLKIKGTSRNPIVSGVARNDSIINIFVDGKLDSTITPQNHPSGTLYFEARLSRSLSDGTHVVNAQSYEKGTNKPSLLSNSLYYTYPVVSKVVYKKEKYEQKTAKKPLIKTEKEEAKPEPKVNNAQKQKEEGVIKDNIRDKKDITIKEEESTGEIKIAEPEVPGKVKVKDETAGRIEKETVDQGELPTEINWPLIIGISILIALAVIFVIWYLDQKRKLLNEGIDKLFSDDEVSGENKSKSTDSGSVTKKKSKTSKKPSEKEDDDLPPPPPEI